MKAPRKFILMILIVSIVCVAGCGSLDRWTIPPTIKKIDLDLANSRPTEDAVRDLKKLDDGTAQLKKSIRVEAVSLSEFCALLNREFKDYVVIYDNSIVVPEITNLFEGSINDILDDLALSNNLVIETFRNKFYILKQKSDLSKFNDIIKIETDLEKEIIQNLAQKFNVEVIIKGSLVVVYGKVDDLKQFENLIISTQDQVQSYEIKLVFVRLSESDLLQVQAELEIQDFDLIASRYNFLDSFTANLKARATDQKKYEFTQQTIYATDGSSSSVKIGNEINREQRSLSEMGVSSVSGWRNFNDGIELEITPKRLIGDNVLIQLDFTKSKFSNMNDLSKSQVDLRYQGVLVKCKSPYYLTSYNDGSNAFSNLLFGGTKQKEDEKIAVWIFVKPVL